MKKYSEIITMIPLVADGATMAIFRNTLFLENYYPSGRVVRTKIDLSKLPESTERAARTTITEGAVSVEEMLSLCVNAFLSDYRFIPSEDGSLDGTDPDDVRRKLITAYYVEAIEAGARVFRTFVNDELAGINVITAEGEDAARNIFGVVAPKFRGTPAASSLYAGTMLKLAEEGRKTLLADIAIENRASFNLHKTLGGDGFEVTGEVEYFNKFNGLE